MNPNPDGLPEFGRRPYRYKGRLGTLVCLHDPRSGLTAWGWWFESDERARKWIDNYDPMRWRNQSVR